MDEKPRGKGRRSDIDWPAIQRAYEAGETNYSELARRFGVRKSDSISARCKRENWGTKGEIAAQVRSNVISIATGEALESLGDDLGRHIASNLQKHGEIDNLRIAIVLNVLKAAKKYTDALASDDEEASTLTLDQVLIAKNAIDLSNKAVDGSRKVEGVPRDMPSIGRTQQDDSSLVIQQRRLAPKPLESRTGTQP